LLIDENKGLDSHHNSHQNETKHSNSHRSNTPITESETSPQAIFKTLVRSHHRDISEIEKAIVKKADKLAFENEAKIVKDFEAINFMQLQKLELKINLLDEYEKYLMHETLLIKVN
jgi:hypothetical protein